MNSLAVVLSQFCQCRAMFCSPTYVAVADSCDRLELLALPVLLDFPEAGHRYEGKPLHFQDIVVKKGRPFHEFADLAGSVFAFNDCKSFSGYHSMRSFLYNQKKDGRYFQRTVESGGHVRSLELISEGKVDTAAIDSCTLHWVKRNRPELFAQVQIIDSIGPYSTQPVCIATRLPLDLREKIRTIFLNAHVTNPKCMTSMGYQRWAEALPNTYEDIKTAMVKANQIQITAPSSLPDIPSSDCHGI